MNRLPDHSVPWRRRTLHFALVIPAFLLFSINWTETAGLALFMLFFSVYLLPGFSEGDGAGGGMIFPERADSGTLLYPVSILLLALIFRNYLQIVAGGWALLALGDGMAGAVGEAWGRHPLPYNLEKTWEGFAAFAVFGSAGALLLMLWVSGERLHLKIVMVCLVAAVAGAFVESLPVRLSDNITVPLLCAGVIFCAGLAERASLDHNLPYLRLRVLLALGLNLVFALLGLALRQITIPGAIVGFLLGGAIYMSFGYKSFLILVCFIVLASAATQLGYAAKLERGIAERRRGARGWREAAANLAAAAFFSVLVITTPYQTAFLMAMVAALAEAAGDTLSSEIGKWLSPRAYRITTFQRVPAGEDGGVSFAGSAAGFTASLLLAALGAVLGLYGVGSATVVLGAAVVGNLADSLMGATLERQGLVSNSFVNFTGTTLAGALVLAATLHA